LAIIKNKSARLADKTRKELHKIFEQFNLKIAAEANLRVVINILVSTSAMENSSLIGNPMTIHNYA
jgi:hypothetical protein